jgi:sulfite reductase (NADPH) flavoprotein alpha-component
LAFEPGDALGVLPRNDPRLVEAILASTSLAADIPVVIGDETSTLSEALASRLEIALATPRLIDLWADLSDSIELRLLRGEGRAEARTAFLRDHNVIDILRQFPVRGLGAQAFVSGLRPLQPRLYSIASSQAFAPDEVHLAISIARYELNGDRRMGVTSGFFAERASPETCVPVYVQSNSHFRLPADDVPILMIGAGTGIAPYRAFLQEREARCASGKNWLFFGARNFHTDFLYQTEWQALLKSGLLTRMNVAFSRDRTPKTYVQHRLLEHAHDVYGWLQSGAHVYVCGDASRLAPDVHAALRSVIQKEGGLDGTGADEYLAALQQSGRYQVDVY